MIEAWVETELGGVDLGDKRRTRRVMRTVQTFWNRPNASIPEASGSAAEMQAIYDLLSAPTTSPEAIREAHAGATVGRVADCAEVLILQDSSELSFNTLEATEGLGPLSGEYSRGLMMHSALVVDPAGVPQGLLHQEVWARDPEEVGKSHSRRKRLIDEKESQKWLTTVRVCQERLPASIKAWIVGDSESDIYELLAMPRRPGIELLIRATHNRRVLDSGGAACGAGRMAAGVDEAAGGLRSRTSRAGGSSGTTTRSRAAARWKSCSWSTPTGSSGRWRSTRSWRGGCCSSPTWRGPARTCRARSRWMRTNGRCCTG